MQDYTDIPYPGDCSGETYPPTPENILKFCRDKSFTHNWTHSASNQIISSPPHDKADERQSECPASLRREIAEVMSNIFGADGAELAIESYRICWDAITPNQDFIISAHPRCEGLHFAVGGSFHGWKFLPTIGGYVVDMLKSTLQKELKERWAWDRDQGGSSHQELMPQRDWKDLQDGKEEL
jgi:sarcosine oxidase/L-pipecolate oxidase